MKKEIEKNGITYRLVDNYYLPNLELPEQKEYSIGKYGRMRNDYLKKHNKIHYHTLLVSGKLNEHLHDIDIQAENMMELLVRQLSEKQRVTEELKAGDQMKWVGLINNIRNQAEEIVINGIIYN